MNRIQSYVKSKPTSLWISVLWTAMLGYVVLTLIQYDMDDVVRYRTSRSPAKVQFYQTPLDPADCTNRERVERVKQTCRWHRWNDDDMDLFENSNTSKLFNLMASDYHQVVYCCPPNIGCNTFRNLLSNDNVSDVVNMRQPKIHNVSSYLREHNVVSLSKFTVEEAKYRLDSYHKFIIVQHPFTRLLSAFGGTS